jgi:hypothetical protein
MPATAIKPQPVYPRPPIAVLHADLFREPAYEDGEPYAQDDKDDNEAA